MFRLKICGITNRDDALAAIDGGAPALGFIFYPRSPRFITPEAAAAIAETLPASIARVAVHVGWDEAQARHLESLMRVDYFQLHGPETPAQAAALRPRRLIKAFGLPLPPDASPPPSAYDVDAYLMDKASPRYGGTGETFDWSLARAFQDAVAPRPCLLSGGLGPDNVEQALETVQPWGVDVCSGVEASPGRKDHARLARFLKLCRPLLT
jgi:phosphoribosylanthranilate isomerase